MSDGYLLVDADGNATPVLVEVKIGRAKTNDIVLTDPLASRHHATVLVEDESIIVRDENSVNGVLVNGKQIHEPTVLNDADQIQIGEEVLTVRGPLAEAKTIKSTEDEPEDDQAAETVLVERKPNSADTVLAVDADPGKSLDGSTEDEPFEILQEASPQKDQRRKFLLIALILVTICLCCGLLLLVGYLLVKGFAILFHLLVVPEVLSLGWAYLVA